MSRRQKRRLKKVLARAWRRSRAMQFAIIGWLFVFAIICEHYLIGFLFLIIMVQGLRISDLEDDVRNGKRRCRTLMVDKSTGV